jgi:two-component system, sensor histidine kinase PdtaS
MLDGDDRELRLAITDNGRGLPSGFDLARDGSLGLQIVSTLVREDLKGRFALLNGHGARAEVTIPKLPKGAGKL